MKRLPFGLIAGITALSLAAAPATAQTLFTGSGCSGNTFLFCASWTGTYVDATHFSLFITNASGGAPASNLFSAFTQIGIGNVTVADPASMGAITGWQYDANINGFNGFGFLTNQFGSITTNGINNALTAGNSQTFTFTFGSSIGTFAAAQTAFGSAQIAIHDQGPPDPLCGSSKGVLPGGTPGSNTSDVTCDGSGTPTEVVPEPATMTLLATGLAGVVGAGTRRRKKA